MENREGKIFHCSVCGNEVEMTKDGGGILVCCGKNMEEKKEEE